MDLTYDTCVEAMTKEIPELLESGAEFDPGLPNDAFGTLALYVIDRIRSSRDEDAHLLRRAFALFNRMAVSGDEDVENLLVVSVLEILADEREVHPFAREQLSAEANGLFERVLRGWVDD